LEAVPLAVLMVAVAVAVVVDSQQLDDRLRQES
jgi:hypothetical protein